MLLCITALFFIFYSSLSATLPHQTQGNQYENLPRDATTGISYNDSAPISLTPWPRLPWNVPVQGQRYELSILDLRAFIETNPDWWAYLEQGYLRISEVIQKSPQSIRPGGHAEGIGGARRIFWGFQMSAESSIKQEYALDALTVIKNVYDGRQYRELDAVIRVEGVYVATVIVRHGPGPAQKNENGGCVNE